MLTNFSRKVCLKTSAGSVSALLLHPVKRGYNYFFSAVSSKITSSRTCVRKITPNPPIQELIISVWPSSSNRSLRNCVLTRFMRTFLVLSHHITECLQQNLHRKHQRLFNITLTKAVYVISPFQSWGVRRTDWIMQKYLRANCISNCTRSKEHLFLL